MNAVRISVVTVTKNAAAQIATCMRSVYNQTYANVEYVLIDGASRDGTADIARGLARPGDKIVSEADEGIYDAMNKGIAASSGDYVLFLGADDYLVDGAVLADVAATIAVENFPDMLYGGIEIRGADGARTVFHPPSPEEALDLMICGCLPHQATFAHRRMFTDKVGLFDQRYRVQADYDWFLRALVAPGATIRNVRRVIASFAMGGTSSSLAQGQRETYEIQNAFPTYQQRDWVEKRLRAFQCETLALRLRLQANETKQRGAWLRRSASRVLSRLAAIVRP